MNWLKEHLDPKYVKVCAYAGVTVLITAATGLLLYRFGAVLTSIWSLVKAVLQPIIWGAMVCYILQPVVRIIDGFLAQRGHITNEKRRLFASVIIALLIVLVAIAGIISLLLLVVTRSIESISFDTLQTVIESFQGDVKALVDEVRSMAESFGFSIGDGAASAITNAVGKAADIATTMVFSIIFAVYFLLDGESVYGYFIRLYDAIKGDRKGVDLRFVLDDADHAFSGYIRGQFVDAIIIGALTSLVFAIIGVPYGPVIGVLTGIGNLIPYVGGPVGFGTTIIVCLVEGNYGKLAAGVIALAVIMFVDGNIINPRLLSEAVEVHPLLVVAALIAGSAVGGIAGMLVAVPTAAFLKAELDRWIAMREKAMGKADGGEDAGE